jgi:fructan beta-fructosidase
LVFANEQGEEMIIGYQQLENQYFTDRRNSGKTEFSEDFSGKHIAPRIAESSSIHMTVLLDVSSVELFADGGEVVMTDIMFPHEDYSSLELRAVTTVVNIEKLILSPLKPAKIQ